MESASPVPLNSRLVAPEHAEQLVADLDTPTAVMLHTHDKFGNACTRGGLRIAGRLQLIKQGVNDNKILMPNNHSVTIDDLHNGTYAVKIACQISATVKLIVNMDKDLPGASGELPPMQLVFERDEDAAAAQASKAALATAPALAAAASAAPAAALTSEAGARPTAPPPPGAPPVGAAELATVGEEVVAEDDAGDAQVARSDTPSQRRGRRASV